MGTNFNYDDTDHQVIFDRINGGAGSGSLQEASQAWQRLGDDVGAIGKSYVHSGLRGILASREGAAAEAAAAATSAMLPWMDDVAQIATAAAQRAQGQADYWVTAKHNVPPVPPAPQSASFFGDPTEWMAQKMDWLPGLTTEEEKAQQRQQDAAEQARQAMRVYQSNSNGNVDLTPAFTTPQALNASIGALSLTDSRVDGTGSAAPTTMGGGVAGHHAGVHQPAAHPMAAYQPVATTAQLAEGGPAAPVNAAPVNVAPGSGQWGGNPTPSQGMAQGAVPVGTGLGANTVGQAAPRSAQVGGIPGALFGRGVSGANGSGAARTGFGPKPSVGAAQFSPRPDMSAHPAADGVSGARGAAAPTGAMRGAGYGEPFVGAAGQRGEEDREHRSKYLVHDDSNAIVGDLPPTAPPVIGADPG
ncbi:MAG TPA: PPE domain-containing protein [Pseudonocardiaceae bacterium]|nr:PPE domain-containing protein [Pseudonocardiaceae bacterium]